MRTKKNISALKIISLSEYIIELLFGVKGIRLTAHPLLALVLHMFPTIEQFGKIVTADYQFPAKRPVNSGLDTTKLMISFGLVLH